MPDPWNSASGPILIDGQWKTTVGWSSQSIQYLRRPSEHTQLDLLTPVLLVERSKRVNMQDCFTGIELGAKAANWETEWTSSKFCCQIIDFLKEHASRERKVNKIVCFCLGCLATNDDRRSYMQHLAAVTIRDFLTRLQGGDEIKVYAQDPNYRTAGISYLYDTSGMSVLQDPEGFRMLDGNTFVISIGPNPPVRQVAVDITHDEGGPAGMLCDVPRNDGLHIGSNTLIYECSPALLSYAKNCVPMEFNNDARLRGED